MDTSELPRPARFDGAAVARDLGFAVRALLRAKAFAATAVLTLALGMFLTVTVWLYSAWTITSTASYQHPETVYCLGFTAEGSTDFIPYQIAPQLQAYREQLNLFAETAAVSYQTGNVVVDQQPVASSVARVAEGTFGMLAMAPTLGRPFLPTEYRPGGDDVVIVSAQFWKEQLHSDPEVLKHPITIDDRVCRVVGVMGEKQNYPIYFYFGVYRPWVPVLDPAKPFEWGMVSMVRLKPGVTPQRAMEAMKQARLNLSPQYSKWLTGQTPTLRKPNQIYRPEVFRLLLGAAVFLFAIACLNTMNLVLVRVLGRSREFSIRRAIGGTQGQVVRLIVMEVAILAVAAGILVFLGTGLLMNRVLMLWTGYLNHESLWGAWTAHEALAVLVAIAIAAIGGAATWRMRGADISAGLKEGGRAAGDSRRSGRGRSLLVMLQAAFAVVLLAGAGLMIRTFQNTAHVDLGLDPNGKVNVYIAFPNSASPSNEARLQTFDQIAGIFRQLPKVRAVGYGSVLNFTNQEFQRDPSLRLPDGRMIAFEVTWVSEHYPEAAGLRLVKGRWMSQAAGAQEVVINETLAKNRFGEANPIGQVMMIKNDGKDWMWTVTGVVHDVRPGLRTKAANTVYEIARWWPPGSTALVLNYEADPPPEIEGQIRRAVYKCNPHLVTLGVQTVNEQLRQTQFLERQALNILRWLAAIALLLASVGLFSVLAYNVDQRRPEFGVRLALGAPPGSIVRLVLRRGLTTAGIGVMVGCAGALGLTRLMSSLLFQTRTFEPAVYVSVVAVLLLSAGIACWVPSRRAAKVDIARLLRMD